MTTLLLFALFLMVVVGLVVVVVLRTHTTVATMLQKRIDSLEADIKTIESDAAADVLAAKKYVVTEIAKIRALFPVETATTTVPTVTDVVAPAAPVETAPAATSVATTVDHIVSATPNADGTLTLVVALKH